MRSKKPGLDDSAGGSGRPHPGFYHRLSRPQRREYDRSDAIVRLPLPADSGLGLAATRLVEALERGELPAVRRAAQELADGICARLEGSGGTVDSPGIRVLRTRPRRAGAEYHGLYTLSAQGKSEIRVWMLTAANRQVVKPRTFMRTLLHELVHHFDITVLDLPNSFHTAGFHARESSLLDSLERGGARIPGARRKPAPRMAIKPQTAREKPAKSPRPKRTRAAVAQAGRQLDLFA